MRMASFLPPPRLFSTLSLRHFAPKTKNNYPSPRPKCIVQPAPKRIAVIGGGLSGLATTYHLLFSISRQLRKRSASHPAVTIFDSRSPGTGGASSAAAGLLHPFTPRVKKKAWKATKSMHASLHLLDCAAGVPDTRGAGGGSAAEKEGFVKFTGLLRLAKDVRQAEDFRVAVGRYPTELEFLSELDVRNRFPSVREGAGVFLKDAAVVNMGAYMKRLWEVCENSGRAEWECARVEDVRTLLQSGYDTVVLCAGGGSGLLGVSDVPITPCRGQNVILRGDFGMNVPVISGKYVIPDVFGEGAVVGATFERMSEDDDLVDYVAHEKTSNIPRAVEELREPVGEVVPGIWDRTTLVSCTSGLRALPPRGNAGSIPVAASLGKGVWLFSGLGSRGLLHHAYLGRELARAIASGDPTVLPIDARRFDLSYDGGEIKEEAVMEG